MRSLGQSCAYGVCPSAAVAGTLIGLADLDVLISSEAGGY
jgi:hypothetical protein